jgi:hypothetical protein
MLFSFLGPKYLALARVTALECSSTGGTLSADSDTHERLLADHIWPHINEV